MFEFIKNREEAIIFLQETHSVKEVEKTWNDDFSGQIFYSHGTSNSRGVAIFIKQSLEFVLEKVVTDKEGRLIILKIEIQGAKFHLINCYAPVGEKEQGEFFQAVNEKLINVCPDSDNLIMGGDFNIIFDPDLDKQGGRKKVKQESLNVLNNILENFDLVDIWRVRNPSAKRFTWRQRKPLVQCRLDFWLISNALQDLIVKTDIVSAISTDHSAINVFLRSLVDSQRGPSYWKLNTDLLNDINYVNLINDSFPNWLEEFSEYFNEKRLLWDLVKFRIRQVSVSFSKKKAKEKRLVLSVLEKRLRYAELRLSEFPSDERLEEVEKIKNEIDKEYEKKAKGSIIRSKSSFYEEEGKNSKHFLNLEKRNKTKTTVRSLKIGDDKTIDNPTLIQKELYSFYESLYQTKCQGDKSDDLNTFLESVKLPQLDEDDKELCEGRITYQELKEVLTTFGRNKSPGNDGLPIEFYIMFFKLIEGLLLEALNEAYEKGELSNSQRQGVITLIEKKGQDKRLIKNWRPISLINVDAKIASKIIARRIQKVLPKIIHHNQTAYVKGRFIGEGLRLIDDLFEYTHSNSIPGLLLTVDFEKAFDSVEWSYIDFTLDAFNFGSSIRKWVNTFYNNTYSCVMNGGFSTGYFPLQRGVRQGDPLSPYLFVLSLEILLCKIRQTKQIKGVFLGNYEIKLTAYADDLTLFLDSRLLRIILKVD